MTVNGNPAAIISHENVLARMTAANRPVTEMPLNTFFEAGRDFYFNGEAVFLHHVPAAHNDGDIFVYFRGSDVLVAGDLFVTTQYPVIDLAAGGGVDGFVRGVERDARHRGAGLPARGRHLRHSGPRARRRRSRHPHVPRHDRHRSRAHRRPASRKARRSSRCRPHALRSTTTCATATTTASGRRRSSSKPSIAISRVTNDASCNPRRRIRRCARRGPRRRWRSAPAPPLRRTDAA